MFISSKSVAALSVAVSLISSTSAFAPKSSTTSTSTKVGAATLADAFGGITNPFAPKQQMPTPPPQAPQNDNDEDPRRGAMAIDIDGIAFSVSCVALYCIACTCIIIFAPTFDLACVQYEYGTIARDALCMVVILIYHHNSLFSTISLLCILE